MITFMLDNPLQTYALVGIIIGVITDWYISHFEVYGNDETKFLLSTRPEIYRKILDIIMFLIVCIFWPILVVVGLYDLVVNTEYYIIKLCRNLIAIRKRYVRRRRGK